MRIITLDECDSTNTAIRSLTNFEAGECVALRALRQTHGRGQRGNIWESEPDKNVTISISVAPGNLTPDNHFLISMGAALAVVDTLADYELDKAHDVRIKWPNDILVDGMKIAGILIENSLSAEGRLKTSVIGIGLNVNQTWFSPAAPNATSMTLLSQKTFDVGQVAVHLAEAVERFCHGLNQEKAAADMLPQMYHALLWRSVGTQHNWREAASDKIFTAYIDKVYNNGRMELINPQGTSHAYYFKEVFPTD